MKRVDKHIAKLKDKNEGLKREKDRMIKETHVLKEANEAERLSVLEIGENKQIIIINDLLEQRISQLKLEDMKNKEKNKVFKREMTSMPQYLENQ